jgi:hypothetical protein
MIRLDHTDSQGESRIIESSIGGWSALTRSSPLFPFMGAQRGLVSTFWQKTEERAETAKINDRRGMREDETTEYLRIARLRAF